VDVAESGEFGRQGIAAFADVEPREGGAIGWSLGG